jgi:hypothetical protein
MGRKKTDNASADRSACTAYVEGERCDAVIGGQIMKVETKYNIKDIVWCYDYYHNLVSGTIIESNALETERDISIVYTIKVKGTGGSTYNYHQHECTVYSTEQEALK